VVAAPALRILSGDITTDIVADGIRVNIQS
jgi:hypothetical protein